MDVDTCALVTAMAWKHVSATQSLRAKVLTTVAASAAVSVLASADTDGRQGSLPGRVHSHRSFRYTGEGDGDGLGRIDFYFRYTLVLSNCKYPPHAHVDTILFVAVVFPRSVQVNDCAAMTSNSCFAAGLKCSKVSRIRLVPFSLLRRVHFDGIQ